MLMCIHTRGLCYGGDDGAPTTLEVYMTIECEACGTCTIVLPGHHVRCVIQALQAMADAVPELTPAGEVTQICVSVVTPRNN